MSRRLLVAAAILFALATPALGHTNYGHSHTCNSSHGNVQDSSTTRHRIGPGVHPYSAWLYAEHRTWIPQDGGHYTPWTFAHGNYIYC